jgi:uncharacterized protein YceK
MHRRIALLLVAAVLVSGCAVITVAGAAAGAAITVGAAVVSTGVKATGAVIDVVSGDDEDDD